MLGRVATLYGWWRGARHDFLTSPGRESLQCGPKRRSRLAKRLTNARGVDAEAMRGTSRNDPLSDRRRDGVDLDAQRRGAPTTIPRARGGVRVPPRRLAVGGLEGSKGLVGLKPSQIGYFDPAHYRPSYPQRPAKTLIKERGEEVDARSLTGKSCRRPRGFTVRVVLAIDALVGR